MNHSILRLHLDLTSTCAQYRIECKRGMTARTLRIRLRDKDNPYKFTANSHAYINIEKPDGTHVLNDCTISLIDNIVVYEMSDQAVSAVGTCKCTLSISDGEKVLYTPWFEMYVSDTTFAYQGYISSNDVSALMTAIARASNLECDYDDGKLYITNSSGETKEVIVSSGADGGDMIVTHPAYAIKNGTLTDGTMWFVLTKDSVEIGSRIFVDQETGMTSTQLQRLQDCEQNIEDILTGREILDEYVRINQGSTYSGKYLTIGPDGKVTLSDPPESTSSGGMTSTQLQRLQDCEQKIEDIETGRSPVDGIYLSTLNTDLTNLKGRVTTLENNGTSGSSGGTAVIPSEFITLLQNILKDVSFYDSNQQTNIANLANYASSGSESGGTTTRTLSSISAVASPTSYTVGTNYSAVGITVTAHYSDNTTAIVTGFTRSSGTIASGSNSISVSYGGKSTTVTVTGTASAPTLSSIEVTWSATSADVGTNTRDLISSVKAVFSDGSKETVTAYAVSPATIAEGSQTVTVTYSGKGATQTITGVASSTEKQTESLTWRQTSSYVTGSTGVDASESSSGYYVTSTVSTIAGGVLSIKYDDFVESYSDGSKLCDMNIYAYDETGTYRGYNKTADSTGYSIWDNGYKDEHTLVADDFSTSTVGFSSVKRNCEIHIPAGWTFKLCIRRGTGTGYSMAEFEFLNLIINNSDSIFTIAEA